MGQPDRLSNSVSLSFRVSRPEQENCRDRREMSRPRGGLVMSWLNFASGWRASADNRPGKDREVESKAKEKNPACDCKGRRTNAFFGHVSGLPCERSGRTSTE